MFSRPIPNVKGLLVLLLGVLLTTGLSAFSLQQFSEEQESWGPWQSLPMESYKSPNQVLRKLTQELPLVKRGVPRCRRGGGTR